MSKEFTRELFTWLYQINGDSELQAVDLKTAIQLTRHFNSKDGGRAFPSYKHVADAIMVSEHTVIRSVQRLHKLGHLRIEWGQRGRGHPNQYWAILKPAPVQVLEGDKIGTAVPVSAPGKPALVQVLKPAAMQNKTCTGENKTCTAVQENHLKNQGEAAKAASPGRETRAAAPPHRGPADAGPGGRSSK